MYRGTLAELAKSVAHGSCTGIEVLKNQISGASTLGKPSIEYGFWRDTHTKIVIWTSLNEFEISTFYAFQCHSIGVLWFLGVLWDCGKVNCDHSDIPGDCIHKIKCSHETNSTILVVSHENETRFDFLGLLLTLWTCIRVSRYRLGRADYVPVKKE